MDLASVYLQVIRNVVDGVRADFSTEQLDETSLRTLAALWEHKLLETGSLPNDLDGNKRNVEKHVQANSLDQAEKRGAKRKEGMSSKEAVTTAEETHVEDRGEASLDKAAEQTGAGLNVFVATAQIAAQLDATIDRGETLSSDSDEESQGLHGVDVHTNNLALAQFDKVTRAKNKWKCSLKGGVMSLNGKDVLFGKASGEFFWN